jgi:ligand-binding SRPBCC domain-containing protein
MFHVSAPHAGTRSFEFASELPANSEAVWRQIASADGINAELWPIRMHLPREIDVLAAASEEHGRGILISLLGIVPIDWHWLRLESLTIGQGFHEISSSLLMKRWGHIRTIEPLGNSCTLRDQVELTPRLGFLAPLVTPVYRFVFRRRHRALQQHFGSHQP